MTQNDDTHAADYSDGTPHAAARRILADGGTPGEAVRVCIQDWGQTRARAIVIVKAVRCEIETDETPAPVTPAAVRAAEALSGSGLLRRDDDTHARRELVACVVASAYAEQDEEAKGVILLFRELDKWVGDKVQAHGSWQVFKRTIDKLEASMDGTP